MEKAHDAIDRHGMRQMLRVFGVGGKWLEAVKSFYVESRACVRVGVEIIMSVSGFHLMLV